MEFLEPLLLWGGLAVTIPVVIHFWHQKRGKVITWAATQWLTEKNQQQHRGIQLENLPLLLLRCLLVLFLAFLLSGPVMHWLNPKPLGRKIHLVQPDALLVNNVRFELDNALRNGETVYWIAPTPESAASLTPLPAQRTNPRLVQTAINQLRDAGTLRPADTLQLYLVNNAQYRDTPYIFVPVPFQVHAVTDTVGRPVQPYLVAADNQNLYVNAQGKLTSSPTLPAQIQFSSKPVHTGPLSVLLDYRNPAERQTVAAALGALAEVYALDLEINTQKQPDKAYQWVLTDRPVTTPTPQTVYVVSGNYATSLPASNIRYVADVLTPQTAELVAGGQLPEWLGELLVQQFGLQPAAAPLGRQEWANLFVRSATRRSASQAGELPDNANAYLTLLFMILIGMERWLALRRNA
ncbi:hypothetical protein GCM10023187_09210 [Nibrella viscosa]|uniref:Aerotolerance regulator N-terminal domain-containing protein n=1 Tax=Nibrella viscosa TaxID=1084524 RepID=A0ABP8JZQ9_9BACT